ncbi:MAG: T9SS type A sorting domain-containing protein [Aureispira sp.]|nr:T9SS type A sorting domain-containing protein [Aureispira sp.]
MRVLSTLIFSFIFLATQAQIGLEHIYNYSQGSAAPMDVANLESAGKKYVVQSNAWEVNIYNLNHSIYKTISIPTVNLIDTNAYDEYTNRVFYIKEGLFDQDAEVEFMLMIDGYNSVNNNDTVITAIINETGSILFKQGNVRPVYKSTDILSSIFNTATNGTKMILSDSDYPSTAAYVYSLPGTLSCDPCGSITGFRSPSVVNSAFEMENSPNPAQNYTNINYQLPQDVEKAVLTIYTIDGVMLKNYTIDQQFDHLRISTQELSSGTYLYSIRTDKGEVQSKKMIVIK